MADTTDAHGRIIEAVEALADVSVLVRDVAEALRDAGEFEALLEFYGVLEDNKRVAQFMADSAGSVAVDAVPDRFGDYLVPGGGVFKVVGGRERKRFDNPRLIGVLATALQEHYGIIKVVDADGDITDPDQVLFSLVEHVCAAAGATAPSFSAWRSGVCKALGLKLNDYAELEETPLRPRIEGRTQLT